MVVERFSGSYRTAAILYAARKRISFVQPFRHQPGKSRTPGFYARMRILVGGEVRG